MRSNRTHAHTLLACLLGTLGVANVNAFSISFTNSPAADLFSSPAGSAKPVGDGPFEFTNSLNFSRGNLNVYVASLTMNGESYVVSIWAIYRR